MRQFQAVTASGTMYMGHNGNVSISSASRSSQYIHNATLKSIPHDVLGTWDRVEWDYIHALPEVDAPIVGEHLVTLGLHEWRISTEMKVVEAL